MVVDIDVKPAHWGKDLIKYRLININRYLTAQNLKLDEKKFTTYYSKTIFTQRRLTILKDFFFIKVFIPANRLADSYIMQMNQEILMFDWTYQLTN